MGGSKPFSVPGNGVGMCSGSAFVGSDGVVKSETASRTSVGTAEEWFCVLLLEGLCMRLRSSPSGSHSGKSRTPLHLLLSLPGFAPELLTKFCSSDATSQ